MGNFLCNQLESQQIEPYLATINSIPNSIQYTINNLKEGGLEEGGLKEGGLKEGGLKEGGLKEGELKEGGLKEGGLKEGDLKESGLKEGGLYRLSKDGNIINIELKDPTLIKESNKLIMLAADYSGSMGRYIYDIDKALKSVYNDYPDCTDVYFIPFASRATSFSSDKFPDVRTLNGYGGIGGGTDFNSFIREINSILALEKNKLKVPIIYLFTDGECSNYQEDAEVLVATIHSLGGTIYPIEFGRDAKLKHFRETIKFTSINDLNELLSGTFSEFIPKQIGRLIQGENSISISFKKIGDKITGSSFGIDTSTKKAIKFDIKTPMLLVFQDEDGDKDITLTFDPTPIIEDNSKQLNKLIEVLETYAIAPSVEMNRELVGILNTIKELNTQASQLNDQESKDDRLVMINTHINTIIGKISVSGAGMRASSNISPLKDIGEIIKKMTRLQLAIQSGKERRNLSNASRKLAKYSENIKEILLEFKDLKFPTPKECTRSDDSLFLEIYGNAIMFAIFNNKAILSTPIDDILEQKDTIDSSIANIINNPSGAYILGGDQFISDATLLQIRDLERITFTEHSLLIPYANHDFLWLQKAYRFYASLLMIGHPIKLQSNSGQVFLSGIISLLQNTDTDSLHNLNNMSFIYGYAYAFANSKVNGFSRMNIYSQYCNDEVAIFKSRSKDSDNQIGSIHTALGALVLLTNHQFNPTCEKYVIDKCMGLIKSIYIENIRQFLQLLKDTTIYDKLTVTLQDVIGLSSYNDDKQYSEDANIHNYNAFLDQNSEKFTKLVNGNILPHQILSEIRALVSIKYEHLEKDFDYADLHQYLPVTNCRNDKNLVCSYFGILQLTSIIKLIEALSTTDWMGIANSNLGYMEDAFLASIVEKSKSRSILNIELIVFEALIHLAITKGNPLDQKFTSFENNSYLLLPESRYAFNVNNQRAMEYVNHLLETALALENIDTIKGLLMIYKLNDSDTINLEHPIYRFGRKIASCEIASCEISSENIHFILKYIGDNIKNGDIKQYCISLGIEQKIIDDYVKLLSNKPAGALCPRLQFANRSFQKVMRVIEEMRYNAFIKPASKEDIENINTNLAKENKCVGESKFCDSLVCVTGEDIGQLLNLCPTAIKYKGGFYMMRQFSKLLFLRYENNRKTYYHFVGFNGHYKYNIHTVGRHWSEDADSSYYDNYKRI